MSEAQQRFEEIISEINELLKEAVGLIPCGSIYERANAYWYSHIATALNDDNDYIGRSMCNMQDTLEEWKDLEDGAYDRADSSIDGIHLEPVSDEDWDYEAGRPASMRDEDRD